MVIALENRESPCFNSVCHWSHISILLSVWWGNIFNTTKPVASYNLSVYVGWKHFDWSWGGIQMLDNSGLVYFQYS